MSGGSAQYASVLFGSPTPSGDSGGGGGGFFDIGGDEGAVGGSAADFFDLPPSDEFQHVTATQGGGSGGGSNAASFFDGPREEKSPHYAASSGAGGGATDFFDNPGAVGDEGDQQDDKAETEELFGFHEVVHKASVATAPLRPEAANMVGAGVFAVEPDETVPPTAVLTAVTPISAAAAPPNQLERERLL
jgi:hypothetical protein